MEKVKLNRHFISDIFFYQEGPGVRKWQFTEFGVKLINVGNINNGKIDLSSTKINISEEEAYGKYSHFLIDEGDLLIACSGIVVENFHNKIAFINKEHLPLCLNTSTMRFKELPEKNGDLNFLKYFLQTNDFKSQLGKLITGSAQLNFGPSHIRKIEIPLPPLATQQRIATILDQADAIIQNNRAIVQKYDALTQSLFLDMFGDPVKNEKMWKLVPAERHIDLLTGFAFKSELYSKNPNHIRLCGGLIIMPWGIEWDKSNKWDISNSDNLDKYQLEVDDIVMAMDRPWIGSGFKIAQIKDEDLPSLLVQRTARIRSNDFNSKFLFHFYKSSAFERHAKPTETTVPHISPRDIKSYLLFDVPIALQNQFAERVAVIETQKQQAQQALAKSEALFQSLLQRAFKGELS